MRKPSLALGAAVSAAALALTLVLLPPPAVHAKGEPSVDCSKKANKKKPQCRNVKPETDEELYYAGYWLARAGKYDAALGYLRQARNPDDPRFLTYIGFALRKQGKWDEAMGYYQRALALNADFVVARAYLGEAYLEQGDLARAKAELSEILARCGASCVEYGELAAEIERFEARRG
jgi:tetratricopeptide (TPR) repeat protein